MIKMENDVLSVEIAEHGAELTKLYNKKTGTDLLWDAEPKILETSFTGAISKCREKPIRTQ